MTRYGYVRVSTKEQRIERQVAALTKEGIERKLLYIDKASGKNFERQAYQRLRKRLRKGDELYLLSIDRLGRNYQEIIEEWRYLIYEKQVTIVVLDLPLLQALGHSQDVTKQLLNDFILQLFSYVAQIEREMIHARQKEGIVQAQKRGVRFGRPTKEIPEEFDSVMRRFQEGCLSIEECCQELGISRGTFYKWRRAVKSC